MVGRHKHPGQPGDVNDFWDLDRRGSTNLEKDEEHAMSQNPEPPAPDQEEREAALDAFIYA